MAVFRTIGLKHFSSVVKSRRLFLLNDKSFRPLGSFLCCQHFRTAVNMNKYRSKNKFADLKEAGETNTSNKTSSVYAELFSDDKSIKSMSSLKTKLDESKSMAELNELEDLLNRRLSMKISNTVLHTGETYNAADSEIIEQDDGIIPSEFGESDNFLEEIQERSNDSKSKPRSKLPRHEVYTYGTADPSVPSSDCPCAGCGALLHCQDPGIPGFVPSQILLETSKERLKRTICKRCYVLTKHKVALDVSASPEEYIRILEEIKQKRALILLVVDLLDFPNSLFKEMPKIVGKKRPFYVIGNKVDLLPRDSGGYLERTRKMLVQYLEEYGISTSNQVKHIALVSAKTGYGIEELVTKLLVDWERKGDVYVVGCTNVGKSTLYNALLSSDYCRNLSRDFILRATISNWPGTTLNTLKFPVFNPSSWKLAKRAERLLKDRDTEVEEKRIKKKNQENKKRLSLDEYTLRGKIGQTFSSAREAAVEELHKEEEPFTEVTYSSGLNASEIIESKYEAQAIMKEKIKNIMAKYDAEAMEGSIYCYDTPGVVNKEQVINLLNERELFEMLAKRLIMPRTFTMASKETMFVTGLGRIDYLQGNTSLYFTVICSTSLPVHIVSTQEADEFYRQHAGTKHLGVPLGDEKRLSKLPALQGKDFSINCVGWAQSAADIILSSIGWVSVAGPKDMEVEVKAYTPEGRGCVVRSPSLLEQAVNLKGKRIRGTRSFHTKLKKTK